ncbi:MAG TPA: RNA methyltransferase, partial [Candidatus Saccharimonadales bacterium]|nr:RNA methyltransferase [Candidatus Saccharimonadales bacterium]
AEALRDPSRIRLALAAPGLLASGEAAALVDALARCPGKVFRVDDALMGSLSSVESTQGLLIVAERPSWSLEEILESCAEPLIVVAHGIQDPGNLGALARVAEAAGAAALVCIGGADPFSPRSVRASAGSIPRFPVIEGAGEILGALKRAGVRLAGAVAHGGQSYREQELRGPLALVLGSEGGGLPPSLLGEMEWLIRVPLREGVESLNVTAAAAVILFHLDRAG